MKQTPATPLINEQGASYGQAVGKFILAWLFSVVVGSLIATIAFLVGGEGIEGGLIILVFLLGSTVTSMPYALMGIIGLLIARGQTNLPVSWRRKRFFLVVKLVVLTVFLLLALFGGDYVFLAILPVWGIPGFLIEWRMLKDRHFEPSTIPV